MRMDQDIDKATLADLWSLKKHYDARLPENVRQVPLPADLCQNAVQTWLVRNLVEPEETLENRKPHASAIGAASWRKAFWKRIINQIEAEIAALANEDLEVHEGLMFYLSNLMAVPATSAERFHHSSLGNSDLVRTILTEEDEASISGGTTGLHTWPAALHLANQLIADPGLVGSKHVLELGSGAGMLAILIHQLQKGTGGTLMASDFHDAVLNRLQSNLDTNTGTLEDSEAVSVKRLDWSNPMALALSKPLDLILASDVIYDPSLASPLAGCLAYLLKGNPNCSTLLCQTVRNEDTMQNFLDACSTNSLRVEELQKLQPPEPAGVVTGGSSSRDIMLFRIAC